MKKAFLRIAAALICVSFAASAFSACSKEEVPKPDGSVPLMYGDNSEALLNNIDRGLRMETYINLGDPLEAYPLSGEDPYERAQNAINKYKEDSPTLSQVYVYLSNYTDKPLDDLAFSQMEKFFELFRENNIRMLLRFAYGTESVDDAPYEIVKIHLGQIGEWFKNHEELINDTLYCLQLGIIGYWGEGHHNNNLKGEDIPKVIADVCNLAPEGIYTQVRTYDLLSAVSAENIPNVGIHDDYIIGEMDHGWSFIPKNHKNSDKFNETVEHAKYTVNDGEMPWGVAKYNDDPNGKPLDRMDGKNIIKQLYAYSMTSFSLEHNYRETQDRTFSMYEWKSQYLTYKQAEKLGISVNPNLFVNSNGEELEMSIYDIIRYHLGYQLVLSDYKAEKGRASFRVFNYGFAAPHNFNYFALVCKDLKTGELKEIKIDFYDKELLQSGAYVDYSIAIPNDLTPVGVKLSTFEGREQCARFANATKFENGVQYFE